MSCTCGRLAFEHSLTEARVCLDRITWRDANARDVAASSAWRVVMAQSHPRQGAGQ